LVEIILSLLDHSGLMRSDIRKVALWYNSLHKLNLLVKEEPEAEKNEPTAEVTSEEKTEAPAKKKKKAAGKAEKE